MIIKTRKCLIVFGLLVVCGVYGAAAMRVELARQGSPVAAISCHNNLCVPHTGSFSSLR